MQILIKMSKQKITEKMRCFNCEHEWTTNDYFECKECPNCKYEPVRIYRQGGFFYAYLEKHPENKPKK